MYHFRISYSDASWKWPCEAWRSCEDSPVPPTGIAFIPFLVRLLSFMIEGRYSGNSLELVEFGKILMCEDWPFAGSWLYQALWSAKSHLRKLPTFFYDPVMNTVIRVGPETFFFFFFKTETSFCVWREMTKWTWGWGKHIFSISLHTESIISPFFSPEEHFLAWGFPFFGGGKKNQHLSPPKNQWSLSLLSTAVFWI